MMQLLAGGIIESVSKLASDLITTDKERIELDIKAKQIDADIAKAQIDVNKIEAASESIFVSGGRPFIMWICGIAFAYASILEPLLRFATKVWFGYTGDFPVIDTDLTLQVLLGILGLGTLRTVEKAKGVHK